MLLLNSSNQQKVGGELEEAHKHAQAAMLKILDSVKIAP